MTACPVCLQKMQASRAGVGLHHIECRQCGTYFVSASVLGKIKNAEFSPRSRANFSGWLIENQGFQIDTRNIDRLLNLSTPSFHERADKALLLIEIGTPYAGKHVQRENSWVSRVWCINEEELTEILQYLVSCARIEKHSSEHGLQYKILPNGWAHLEELKSFGRDSVQGFVAMWFDDSLRKLNDEIISQAILDAGYKPHRVDQREHNDKIDDEIIAQIRQSRFVVADFTGHRGGVYFEAGFAKGLGMEVFWTCRRDEIDKLHFDIRQYNCIDWESANLGEFRERLTNRIEAVLGHGSYNQE
ncbi:MAG: hypothetical protein IT365_08860 [Candidatus Hydrogenedentes bacterium]|nr:hypothetical protein [Candidatus Hydrogenedentota bacterium]